MSASLADRRLPRRDDPVHPQPGRAVESGDLAPRQPLRHDRHGDRRARHGARPAASRRPAIAWIVGAMVVGGSDRPVRGARRADDADAGAGRADAQPRRPRRGAGRLRQLHRSRRRPRDFKGAEQTIHEVEIYIGVLIGAVTFSGSLIAFGKLSAKIGGKPLLLPGAPLAQPRRPAGRDLAAAARFVGAHTVDDGHDAARRHDRDRAALRRPHGDGDRRRRHAGRGVDAEQLLGLGGGGDRLHADQRPADRHRRAGRLERRDPLLHHVPRDEPQLPQRDRRRLRHRRRRARRRRRGAQPAGEVDADQRRGDRGAAARREERDHRAGLRHGGGAGAAHGVTRSPSCCARRASTCASASTRSPAACRAT